MGVDFKLFYEYADRFPESVISMGEIKQEIIPELNDLMRNAIKEGKPIDRETLYNPREDDNLYW